MSSPLVIPPHLLSLPYAFMYEGTDENINSTSGGINTPGPNWDPGPGGAPGANGDRWKCSHPDILDIGGGFVNANGDPLAFFGIYRPGIYLVQAFARWGAAFTSAKQLEITTNNSSLPHNGFVWLHVPLDNAQPQGATNMFASNIFTILTIEGDMDTIQVSPKQQSGATRVLDQTWAVCVRLAAFDPEDDEVFVPPAQPGHADAATAGIAFSFDTPTHSTPNWTRVDA